MVDVEADGPAELGSGGGATRLELQRSSINSPGFLNPGL